MLEIIGDNTRTTARRKNEWNIAESLEVAPDLMFTPVRAIAPVAGIPPNIDENMSIDNCTHSIFGVSKVSADLLVQEYGKYFGMKMSDAKILADSLKIS